MSTPPAAALDLAQLALDLERTLKLRTPPIGMKALESAETLKAIPRLRRPQAVHTTDQLVAQAARLGWTIGFTADDLVGEQCRAGRGAGPAPAA